MIRNSPEINGAIGVDCDLHPSTHRPAATERQSPLAYACFPAAGCCVLLTARGSYSQGSWRRGQKGAGPYSKEIALDHAYSRPLRLAREALTRYNACSRQLKQGALNARVAA